MRSKQRALWFLLSCALALGVTAVAQKSGSASAEERAIRAADAQYSHAATAKNLEGTLSFYADDAVLLWPDAPSTMGKQAIRAVWVAEFKDPVYSLSWRTQAVEVSRSGELGYSRGTYDATYTLAGRAMREHGKYLEVWKKQPGGAWRVVADIYNADAPAKPINP